MPLYGTLYLLKDYRSSDLTNFDMIIGTSEVSNINTPKIPKVGKLGESVAEFTQFGWMMMSPGNLRCIKAWVLDKNSYFGPQWECFT